MLHLSSVAAAKVPESTWAKDREPYEAGDSNKKDTDVTWCP